MPEWAFISVGSNIQPEYYLPRAVEKLEKLGEILKVSNVYQNPAIGREDQPDFLNMAVLVETPLPAEKIRKQLREIEKALDRIRTKDKFAPRTIDLDLCILGDQIHRLDKITLPDPDILTHAHLAIPLAELAPQFPHPISKEPLSVIARRFGPPSNLTPRPDMAMKLVSAANDGPESAN